MMEAADRNTQRLKLKGNSDPLRVSDVHRVGTHGGSGSNQHCFRCGS